MEQKGRHFILHLLKFVFGISGRIALPSNVQTWLRAYREDVKSPFTGKIIKALVIFITDDLDHVDTMPHLFSQKYRGELSSIGSDEDFLRFVGRYSVKVLEEYNGGNDSATTTFIHRVTEFLKNILIEEGSITDFLENWNKAADRILKKAESQKSFCKRDPTIFVDLTKEKSFLVDAMNYVLDLFNASPNSKLPSENSQNLLTFNIKHALRLAVKHHKNYLLICDYEHLQDYFHKRCLKKFDEKDFLELCASCVGHISLNNSSLQTSQQACDFLLNVIDLAKRDGKFTSFAELHIAAKDLVETFQRLYDIEPFN